MVLLFQAATNQPSLALTLEGAKDLLTIVALLAGGFWSFKLYRQKRQRFPQANITHEIKHWRLPDGRLLVRVAVVFANVGETLLTLSYGYVRLLRMQPLPDDIVSPANDDNDLAADLKPEISWPVIAKRYWHGGDAEVEPKESDEVIFEFVVKGDLQTIVVESAFENPAKKRERIKFWKSRSVGWNKTTVYELADEAKIQPGRKELMSKRPENIPQRQDKQGPARDSVRPAPAPGQSPARDSIRPPQAPPKQPAK